MKVRQAVVMVGGKGTRLMPLTETKPKPILSVVDKPCIWYLIRSLARAGIEEVILACGYKPGMMEELGDGSDLGIRIRYAYEDEPMGTAGAMKLLEDQLDDTFVASNGDVFADIDVAEEIGVHQDTDAKITIALTPVDNPCEFGIARVDASGRISEFKEKPKPEEVFSNLINAGVYVLQKEVLSRVPPNQFFDFSKDLVPIILSEGGRVQGYSLSGIWMDVGRPYDLLGAEPGLGKREHLRDHRAGDACSRGDFYMGPGSKVANSELISSVVLAGSKVENSRLERALVMRNCKVDGARIINSILGDGCIVKHGAEVLNAVLADNTVVESGQRIDEGRRV